jgi:hypothetical protein
MKGFFVFAEVRPNNGEMKIVKWTREVVYVAKLIICLFKRGML